MKRKSVCIARAVFAAILVVIIAATSVFPALAYEDQYSGNGDIQWRFAEDYMKGIFTLDNRINGTTNDLTLFLVTEDAFYINEWDITYRFEGKMNLDEEYPDYGFDINVGMPLNHTATSSIELGGLPASVRQVQVGIYPGYYNFYNYGYNTKSSSMSGDKWYVKTLGPHYTLDEPEEYHRSADAWEYRPLPDDAFVEVQEGESMRVYVIVGEQEFIERAQEDFENWAVETEAHYIEEAAVAGSHEEIEVEVPEENLEEVLSSAQPEATVEEVAEMPTPAPVFEETTALAEESSAKSSFHWGIVAIVALAAVCALAIFKRTKGHR